MTGTIEKIDILNRNDWRAWLTENHARPESIWVIVHKRSAGDVHVPHEHLVEEALCFGWIDGTRRTVDEHRIMQLFAPRKKTSGWSRVNKDRVDRLVANGKMAPPGIAVIERAKQDGSWSRLDDAENLVVPDDLKAAFERHPESEENFSAFPPSSRKIILTWIIDAKRAETRAKRIEETAALASQNVRAHHPKR